MASEKETLDDKKPEEVIEEQQAKDKEKEKKEESSIQGQEVEEVDEMQVDKKYAESEEEEKEKEKPVKKGKNRGESTEEPVTPITRPTRERKTVERYSESSDARGSTPKPLSIRNGSGTQLKDIPNVAYKLSKRKPDDNLQILHNILFGKKSKVHSLKKNIGQFSGFVWVENEEKERRKTKEKLDKCVKEKLLDFCDVLNIPVSRTSAKKDELTVKLLEFLESPYSTTDSLLAEKEQKGKKQKRKSSASKSAGSSDKSVKKHQKSEVGVKRKWSAKPEGEEADDEQPSDSGNDSENDDEAPKEGSDQEESGSEKEKPKKNKSNEKVNSKKSVKKDLGSKAAEKTKATEKGSSAKSLKSSSKSTPSSSVSKKGASAADSTSKAKNEKAEKKSKKEETESVKENSSSKKQSNKSTSKVSEKGKGKSVKKAKAEPSKEELHAVVSIILKKVNFNTATLSDIIRQLGSHFDLDLMHRKQR
ncbi:hypothetical protein H5410_017358 [Solanum commersonii]|uniref:DEK-C domain-containing protein n=1 Tax=Solanum commersonii TaxID=4109 RepID=A0A9J5ZYV7_SOLCO|nr:hypothetical protein H5410_017358 [Solanum commersonii]